MSNPFAVLDGIGDAEINARSHTRSFSGGFMPAFGRKPSNRLAGRSWQPGFTIIDSLGFRIVSYNVLAQCYAKPKHFQNCKPEHLQWGYRRKALLELLIELDADIFCLQEVDNYHKFWRPELSKLGYSGTYKQRNHHTKLDGCATFFRASRFELVRHDGLEFDHDPSCRNVDGAPDFATHNIAQLNLFRALAIPASNRANGDGCLCIANVHLFWDPGYDNLKIAQAKAAVQAADILARSCCADFPAPIILAGDFNSTPSSEVYRFLTQEAGFISAYAWCALHRRGTPPVQRGRPSSAPPPAAAGAPQPVAVGKIVLSKGFNPNSPEFLPLGVSAGAPAAAADPSWATPGLGHPAEPCFTNYRDIFNGTIDYILIRNYPPASSAVAADAARGVAAPPPAWGGGPPARPSAAPPGARRLRVEVDSTLGMIAADEAAAEGGGLPSSRHPSDHLPIAAALRLAPTAFPDGSAGAAAAAAAAATPPVRLVSAAPLGPAVASAGGGLGRPATNGGSGTLSAGSLPFRPPMRAAAVVAPGRAGGSDR